MVQSGSYDGYLYRVVVCLDRPSLASVSASLPTMLILCDALSSIIDNPLGCDGIDKLSCVLIQTQNMTWRHSDAADIRVP